MLNRENEMSVEELRAMYAGMDQEQEDGDEDEDDEESEEGEKDDEEKEVGQHQKSGAAAAATMTSENQNGAGVDKRGGERPPIRVPSTETATAGGMRGSLLSPSVLSIGGRAAGRPRGEFFAAFFAVARGGDDGIESTATGHGHGGVTIDWAMLAMITRVAKGRE